MSVYIFSKIDLLQNILGKTVGNMSTYITFYFMNRFEDSMSI